MRRLMLTIAGCVAVVATLVGATGCGGVYYTVSVNAAQTRLDEARQMGAETQAPYEYYFAREHLRQAQVEASEASYSDAAGYAETAELYAQKAIDAVQAGNREGKSGDAK